MMESGVSSGARRVILNGKFLSAASTGVHRVAQELIVAMHQVLATEAELRREIDIQLWVPRNGAEKAKKLGVPYKIVGPLVGIPWEQMTLPLLSKGDLILSLCNVGPILKRNAVTMFHDAQVRSSPGSYSFGFRAWYAFHQPIAGRRHRHILTVSGFSRDQLDVYEIASAERISVIYNGLDHMIKAESKLSLLDKFGLETCKYVVALANTQIHKNIGLLLRAFQDDRLRHIKLVLFGNASAADFEAIGSAISPNIIFAGRITDSELKGLYQNALCMAFPSLTEGFGLPPLEAMVVGCPAVVAPCGAIPEVCGDAAVYASPHDVSAWVTSILKLDQDKGWWHGKRQEGLLRAGPMTWSASARQLLYLLKDILSRGIQ